MDREQRKEAADHLLEPQTRFSWLIYGDLFRFPGSDVVLTKDWTGYRSPLDGGKRVYRTGARTAVIRVSR